ncbi:eukaryotic cytochrome b561 domain-containing protein [Ditylenchus destructor]|uniref:Eukaryotic cytochrome b561 domain-containing protein n=1 Tax=Ditylenchus destructor TaxID=166010 RepID=A0AAD4QWE6_9BILA|nr:eukaryotic cytochrome b561 domain-containing protein [Ditylenchus destructor]
MTSLNSSTLEPHAKMDATRLFLYHLHGGSFVVAYLLFVSVAVVSARYIRQVAPNRNIMGLPIWFLLHRALTIIAMVLMLVGLGSIIIGRRWRWPGLNIFRWSAGTWHILVGSLSVLLATSQVVWAQMRPSECDPRRPRFVLFHRTFGSLSFILAVAAFWLVSSKVLRNGNKETLLLGGGIFLATFLIEIAIMELLRKRLIERRKDANLDPEAVEATNYIQVRLLHVTVVYVLVSIAITVILLCLIF